MKKKVNNNSGFALAGTLVLLLVLSLMGTAMFTYSISSLRTVRFSSERKKAEYLAKAGVEAAAYAYQTASSEQNSLGTDRQKAFSTFVREMATQDSEGNYTKSATSNKVYLGYNKSTHKYEFMETEPSAETYIYIGWYEVTLKKTELEYQDIYSSTDVIVGSAMQFKAAGHSAKNSEVVASASGYVPDAVNASVAGYYNDNGVIEYPTGATQGDAASLKPYTKLGDDIKIKIQREYLTKLFQWIMGSTTLTLKEITVKPFAASSAGNMILTAPANTDTIRFKRYSSDVPSSGKFLQDSNSAIFASTQNIFLQGNLNVTPITGGFNVAYLVGKNIVIGGNIEMYVYCLPPSSNQSLFRALWNTYVQKGYGLGKVVIGVPVVSKKVVDAQGHETTINEIEPPINDPTRTGVLNGADFTRAGKVYFGGNVTVTVEIANEGKHRYRMFNSGDVYYFNAESHVITENDNVQNQTEDITYGIDLLQYFLEDAIENNRYGPTTSNRFRTILKFYYGTDNGSTIVTTNNYVNVGGSTNDAMFKIPTNDTARYPELVVPDPSSASALVWTTTDNYKE